MTFKSAQHFEIKFDEKYVFPVNYTHRNKAALTKKEST